MTRDEIIKMARKAGFNPQSLFLESRLERFAALVAAAEREACAKVYEELAANAKSAMELRFQQIAAAIRASGTP